jgi:hypothetical protein
MSVRTELEELTKWISDLSAEELEPTPQPLTRDVWQHVDSDLRRASKKFAEAQAALFTADAALAEFAGDLARETEGLALRAHLLSRRAPQKSPIEPVKSKIEPSTLPATATGDTPGVEHQRDTEQTINLPGSQSPAQLVKSAGDTVETAHCKLEAVEHPDSVTQGFEEELDVLAEMTLSLRQRCGNFRAANAKAAGAKADEGGEAKAAP